MKKLKHFIFSLIFSSSLALNLGAQSPDDFLELRVEPEYFSPNEDGIQDQTFFSPVLQSETDVTRWRLRIRTALGKKTQKLTGAGFSALIKWDGRDKKGDIVPDGEYTGELKVWGDGLKLTSKLTDVVVDTSAPLVEMTVSNDVLDQSIPGQETLKFIPEIVDESPLDRWQLQILDLTGRTVYVYWSTEGVEEVEWDGSDHSTGVFVPQGKYRCVLVAWDAAGNESDPYFLDVTVNVTAREMLQNTLKYVTPVETDLGLLVQLRSIDLFVIKDRKPVINPEAEYLLREVALIVNAYPDVSVRLDGYSRRRRTAQLDRERSSRFSWTIYSYLVKEGNVKASRLTVKGRGRSPSAERKAIDLPIFQKPLDGSDLGLGPSGGVEVILEGDREW